MSSILRQASRAVCSYGIALLRFLHIISGSQGYARRLKPNTLSDAFRLDTLDLVQDLYIKELKAYKPTPVAKDAHVGAVKAYALPPKPQVPSLPADLASELAAYDASEPSKAESKAPAVAAATEHVGTGAEGFLEVLEADLPKAEGHH
ncbi:hypothetical protein PHLCEN_2v7254 [Hermanssonia centrifuga]|uniref:ATP synthase subunit H, mitochondrial n=1 Tax=Hermanssonia centrifuga TaxID=98765 RepID=A0A2R6NX31_9APHY|nr:hypothetical protein PHLCEN_2v7254 [Hermanssonia centrifuga]